MNAFVIGLALGYITYQEKGSVIHSMLFHALINMIAVPITWYLV